MIASIATLAFVRPSVVGPAVSGHATTVIGDHVLAFGGLTGAAGSPASRELWAYSAGAWTNLTQADGPDARMYAAMATLGNRALLFGGWDPGAAGSGGEFKKDVWVYDSATNKWVEAGELPRTVSRHTACTVGKQIVVQTFESTLVCDANGRVRVQPTSGPAPDGFSMSCAAALDDARMIVFGGGTREQVMSNDAYVLDTETWEWTHLCSKGDVPTPRSGAAACALASNLLCVYGGASLGPAGYAGGAGLQPHNDLYVGVVGVDTVAWTRVNAGRLPACVASSATKRRREVVIHGGFDPVARRTIGETRVVPFTRLLSSSMAEKLLA